MTRNPTVGLYVLGCALCLTAFFPLTGRAEEPAEKFLNGLRERGYADMALKYLDRMTTSPLCPADLKKRMSYERGVTLVLAGRLERDPAKQEALLDEAQKTLQDFILRNAKDPLMELASDQLGNVLLERARSKTDQADRPRNVDKRELLLEEARKYYTEAHGVFQKRLTGIKRELMDPKYKNVDAEKQPELADKRDALRGAYVQSQLMSATILRKKAETYPEDSTQYNEGLTAAAADYEEVYKKYRTRLAGLYARLYQARCYQQVGGKDNFLEAQTIYLELLEQPFKEGPLRDLRTKVIRMALECQYESPPKKQDQPKDYMPAIAASVEWLKQAPPNESQDPEWLGLRYWLAMVYKADADARDDTDKLKKKHVEEAKKLARHVAKFPSEFKDGARKLLEETGAIDPTGPKEIEPEDFAEARSAGRDALEQIQLLKRSIPKLEGEIKKVAGEQKKELQNQLKQARENLVKNQENAVKYFRTALALADEDTSIDDKNIVHYFLCYLYYVDGSYLNAAVTGEFLARHFPAGTGARPCAKIAMASYLKLYKDNGHICRLRSPVEFADDKFRQESRADAGGREYTVVTGKLQSGGQMAQQSFFYPIADWSEEAAREHCKDQQGHVFVPANRDFEIQRTVDIANYIVAKWPDQGEAQEALSTLIPFMIKLGRLDDAETYLKRIDPESPQRGESELKTGQAMWSQYLIGVRAIRDAQKKKAAGETVDEALLPEEQELNELKARAAKTLSDGIARMREKAVDPTLALAALSLAQIYVDTQQSQKAVELIEDENVGPKILVDNDHEAAAKEAYKVETYKVALRAYIGALPTVSNAAEGNALMVKAEGVMNALKKLMGTTPAGQRRLIGIYISLATDIQKQIDRATADTKTALIGGFEKFLSRVYEETSDVKELFWVAQTFYSLGEASDDGGAEVTQDAKDFYVKSIGAYQKILKMAKTSKEVTREMVLQVQMRLATTNRRLQRFDTAMDLFEKILLANNMMLNVQVEAAKTYAEWARIGDPVLYDRAILGGRTNEKTKKYTIWGWGKIANQTAPTKTDKYAETFYEARYNLALTRLSQAKRKKTAQDRKACFQLARNDVALTYRFYPEMGGEKWTQQFDSLLKQIQQSLGEQATGLAGLGELAEGPAILKSARAEAGQK